MKIIDNRTIESTKNIKDDFPSNTVFFGRLGSYGFKSLFLKAYNILIDLNNPIYTYSLDKNIPLTIYDYEEVNAKIVIED